MKIFVVKNQYGYCGYYIEGYIEALDEATALKILRERAVRFGKPESLVQSAEEISLIDLNKEPY